jgi:pimeloyl-ACP methyl ester carboxylesterase
MPERVCRAGGEDVGCGSLELMTAPTERGLVDALHTTRPIDGFRLVYERAGSGTAVVLLHGWPGDRRDYRDVLPLLTPVADVIVPDLRGFGDSDSHAEPAADAYSAEAQARSVLALVDELEFEQVVIAGYDIGSRVAQTIARRCPAVVRALVLSPPMPGIGKRVLTAGAQREFWYQAFHQLDLASELLDGKPGHVRDYLRHFWTHWSGPTFLLPEADLERLAAGYARPGAFTASIGWYRAGAGTVAASLTEEPPPAAARIAVPTTILWPDHDPLFPLEWSDRIERFFSDATIQILAGTGHFVPREAPHAFAAAIAAALSRGDS